MAAGQARRNNPQLGVLMSKKKSAVTPDQLDSVVSYKGFNQDWTCRGYQFEVGKSYEMDGKIEACSRGFHACEHPLNVFDYYPPSLSRFAEVIQSGALARHGDDTKIASAKITINCELSIGELVKRAVKYVSDRAKPEGASAMGNRGAASATGIWGAASATGYQGAASATGDQGAASATGDQGAAMASGYGGRVAGKTGNALFSVKRDENYEIISVACGIVGREGIKEGVQYACKGARLVEAAS